jgi:hypothetical protein
VKQKVGTTLDAALYRQAKEAARRHGRRVNDLIEEALARFLASGVSRGSLVEQTKGTFKVSEKALRAVLEEDLYGVD